MNEIIEKFLNTTLTIDMRNATGDHWARLHDLIPDLEWASGHSLLEYQPKCVSIAGHIRTGKLTHYCTFSRLVESLNAYEKSMSIEDFLELVATNDCEIHVDKNEIQELLNG